MTGNQAPVTTSPDTLRNEASSTFNRKMPSALISGHKGIRPQERYCIRYRIKISIAKK